MVIIALAAAQEWTVIKMTREEVLSVAKPMLFNTEMVRAILGGRKTVTRRPIKTKKYIPDNAEFGYTAFTPKDHISCRGIFYDENGDKRYGESFIKNPYKVGDILYVRETWGIYEQSYMDANYILYRADFPNGAKTFGADGVSCDLPTWRPSTHAQNNKIQREADHK